MIKFKFSNYFLILKTICFLLIFNSSNVFGEKNKNFENAIINALENSSKIKSAKYLYESKKNWWEMLILTLIGPVLLQVHKMLATWCAVSAFIDCMMM